MIVPSEMPTCRRCFRPDANLDANLGAATARVMPTYRPVLRARSESCNPIAPYMMSNRLGQVGTPVQVSSGAAFSDADLGWQVGTGRHQWAGGLSGGRGSFFGLFRYGLHGRNFALVTGFSKGVM